MGIVGRQSIYNTVSIGIAFFIGAINMLILYPSFPGKEFQGLIVALLANSNLVQPFISFGVQHTLIKFFSGSKNKSEKDRLLWFVLILPILILIIFIPFYTYFDFEILNFLSNGNEGVSHFSSLIIAIAISTAYFEVFFSWLRVHLKSVFGNFLKEVYPRLLTFLLLIFYATGIINLDNFINYLIVGYYLRLIIVMGYSFKLYFPRFEFYLPKSWKQMLRYSFLIFLSGASASLILDIDKSMIFSLISEENVAFYAVALYITAVIEAPGRAMFQITSPLVAKALNENDKLNLEKLLKKSSLNLIIVSGIIFLIINLNLIDFYKILNKEGYASATGVVIIVSIGKFFSISMGCLNNIISNSKYYIYVFWFSVSSAILAIILNFVLIKSHGIIGAAIATLAVIIFINSCKILLVYFLFKIHPYSLKTMEVFISLVVIYGLIYFIPSFQSSWISIFIRSVLILFLFSIPFFSFRWSKDIIDVIKNIRRKLF